MAAGLVCCGLSLCRMIAVRLRRKPGFILLTGLSHTVHENHELNLRVSQMRATRWQVMIRIAEQNFCLVNLNQLGDNHGMDHTCSD